MKFSKFEVFEVNRSEFPKPKTKQDLMVHLTNVDQLVDEHQFDEGLAYIAGLIVRLSKGRDGRVYGYLRLVQGIAHRKKAFLKEELDELVKAHAALEESLNWFKENDWEYGVAQLTWEQLLGR